MEWGANNFWPGAKDFQFLLISNEYTRPWPAAASGKPSNCCWGCPETRVYEARGPGYGVPSRTRHLYVHSHTPGIPAFGHSGIRTCTDSCRKMTKQFMPHAWRKSNLIRKLLWPSRARTAAEGEQDMHVSQDVLRYWPSVHNSNLPPPSLTPRLPAPRRSNQMEKIKKIQQKWKIKYLQFILTTTTGENKTTTNIAVK